MSKKYTAVLSDGTEISRARKDAALKAAKESGQSWILYSPSGAVLAQETVEESDDVSDRTNCKECGSPLSEHTWSGSQASHLCPQGRTEFNPADEVVEEPEEEPTEAPAGEATLEDDEALEEEPKASKPVDIERMKRKIALLLAKAERTENEHERDTFSAAAEKMMIRLGISVAELEAAGEFKPEKIVEVKRTFPGNYSISMIPFTVMVAQGFGHITILQSKTSGLARNAHIIGQESDVEQFCRLLDSLSLQVNSALHAWQKENRAPRRGLTDMQKYLQHRSFIEGFGQRVGSRLAERRQDEEKDVSTGGALVLAGKDARTKDWIEETYGQLKESESRRRYSSIGNAAGWSAGATARLGEDAIEGTRKGIKA
jgi:hypothetical protein